MGKVILPRTFYRIDSTRVSLREYWWGTKSPLILVALLLKLLRVRIPSSTDDPNVESLAPFESGPEALPEDAAARMRPLLWAMSAQGFAAPLHHRIDDDFNKAETNLVSFVHESGVAWGRVHDRRWTVQTPPKEVLFSEFVTPLPGGRYLWSLSSKPDLAPPPGWVVVRRTGADPATLWAAHLGAVAREGGRSVAPLATADDLRAAVEAHHRAVRNFHLRRGVFAPLTAAQKQTRVANEQARQGAAAEGSRYPEVLAEIRRLQAKKGSALTGVLVLAVSLGLFLATSGSAGFAGGISGTSLRTLAIIVGVLFFHEMGHFVAMRAFRYRNVQMFFIPFLGAAVMGRHYNVAGWKKAVVSLMGPLPGIAMGAAVGAAGLVTDNALLLEIALMALVLNGFNLLPVLPLDGGWVAHTLVGSRHPALDVVLRAGAALALVAFGLWSGDRILSFLAIAIAAGIPLAYRIARTTTQLRREGVPPLSDDEQTIPAATAEAIIARLVASSPRQPTKQLAQATLGVFESLNARPPSVLASLGLGAVQAGAFVAAIAVAGLVVVGQQTSLAGLIDAAATLPAYSAGPGEIAFLRPLAADGAHATVIATFEDAAGAKAAAESASREAGRPVAVLGQTMLLAVPEGDEATRAAAQAELLPRTKQVFVAGKDTPPLFALSCLAPTTAEAAAIEREAGDYLRTAGMNLVAPWADPDPRAPADRARHDRARRTYARVLDAPSPNRGKGVPEEVMRKIEASRGADPADQRRLQEEISRIMLDDRRRAVESLRGAADLDPAVVEAYLAGLGPGGDGEQRIEQALAPLLGPAEGETGRSGALHGFLARDGLLLRIPVMRFRDAFLGPVAATLWLERKGCVDIQYEFTPATGDDEPVD